MRDDQGNDLTPPELEALGALAREAPPPRPLEERVVAGLKARGLIHSMGGQRQIAALAAALAVVVSLAFFGGFVVGEGRAAASAGRATFALLVRDPVGAEPIRDADAAVRAAIAWTEELEREGLFVSGEKLRGDGFRLTPRAGAVERSAGPVAPGAADIVGGFFLIRADDYEDAERIAATCPLLRYGSTIEVRALEVLPSGS